MKIQIETMLKRLSKIMDVSRMKNWEGKYISRMYYDKFPAKTPPQNWRKNAKKYLLS